MHTHDPSPLGTGTPWAVWLLGSVLLATVLGVTWQRQFGDNTTEASPAVQWQRTLNFEDRSNGDIAVVDPQSGRELARFHGEQGFLRGSLRAMARQRMLRRTEMDAPFELIGHVDGRVTLIDTATNVRLHLESFGPTNSAVFSQLQWAR